MFLFIAEYIHHGNSGNVDVLLVMTYVIFNAQLKQGCFHFIMLRIFTLVALINVESATIDRCSISILLSCTKKNSLIQPSFNPDVKVCPGK